jgi:uncharacterized repeat protein (TIGR02543 family)
MTNKRKVIFIAGFIAVILLLVGCGGGGNVPEVVDNTAPVVVEHSLDGEDGDELSESRNSSYILEIIAMDNQSETLELEFAVNDGKVFEMTLKKYGGKFPFSAQIPDTNFTTVGYFEGVISQATLTNLNGNATCDKRFFKKSFTEAKAREYMLEVLNNVDADGVVEDLNVNLNDVEYENIDVAAAFLRGGVAKNFLLGIEYNSLQDFINNSNMPENLISYQEEGLTIYSSGRTNIAIIDKTVSQEKLQELTQTAVDKTKEQYDSTAENYSLTLNRNPIAGGTVTGGGNYEAGETVNITATANTGYRFVNWTKAGVEISTQADYIYTMPSENVTLVANFEEEKDTPVPIPETVSVQGGSFQMGNTRDDPEGANDQKPVHTVKLTYNYLIGKFEVSFDEYDAYCEETGENKPDDRGWGRGTRPVINIGWNDAIAYCNWLSEQEGLQPAYDNSGNLLNSSGQVTTDITQVEGYRLPTEAEWEYAARGGHEDITDGVETNDFKYAGSNNIDSVAWYSDNSDSKTHEIGQKAPNELGVYDMSGNAWEWCQDWYKYDFYEQTPVENPVNLDTESARSIRGASSFHTANIHRIVTRLFAPSFRINLVGFRIARTMELITPQTYTLTLARNNNAWGSVSGGGDYEAGETVNITATANTGYRFVNWTKAGVEISTQANYAYTMPSANVTLVANFEEIQAETYTLTLNRNNNAWGSVSGGGDYEEGTEVDITATANNGYRFVNWTKGGVEISTQANDTYTMSSENVTLVANFEEIQAETYTLTLNRNPIAGGTVTGEGDYEAGTEVDIQATANTGYRFVNWTKGGVEISTQANDTYTMSSENVTLTANFEEEDTPVPIPEMVLVNGGTFMMGNTRDDPEGNDNEKPVHEVELTYDYEIGKYEVTFDEYDAYCEATGESKPIDVGWGRGKRPVLYVSKIKAIVYCNWLSEQEGLQLAYDNDGNLLNHNGDITTDITQVEGYRLPTEAEWEYAARGGHEDIKGGVEINDFKYVGSNNLDSVAWYFGNSNHRTHEVGQKVPNELGLYDMSGNVSEWCHDYYDSNYYSKSPTENPVNTINSDYCVQRGSSVSSYVGYKDFRVADRSYASPPSHSFRLIGLRIARTRK